MWAQPLNGMKSFVPRERQPFVGHQEESKTRLNQISPYRNVQYPHKQQQQPVIIRGYIFDYCENSSLHGFKYISQRDRHWYERVLWSLLCAMAASSSMYLCFVSWQRFVTSPTVSVIETTNFPVSNIPFPSVTLCDANRVHWKKAIQFQERYLSNASSVTIKMFQTFLKAMALVEFGDFDLFDNEFNKTFKDTSELSTVNVSQLMLDVMPECSELMPAECWWRNDYIKCCEIFELQRTEYGYCYSFNSEVSEISTGARKWFDTSAYYLRPPEYRDVMNETKDFRPRRTSTFGPWGGLRFTVTTTNDSPPSPRIQPGIILIVSNPYDYPENGRVIPAGQSVWVNINAQVTYTSDRVRELSKEERNCLYKDEGNSMGLGGYQFHNCMTKCHLDYTLSYCDCVPYFFYSHLDNATSCNISGYMCLAENNSVFNYQKPKEANQYFDDKTKGMECVCSADCSSTEYVTAMSMSPIGDGESGEEHSRNIFFDIHFENPAVVRYRMDISYSWLDLLVAFGGIAGLCLGFSLLSGAELIFYLTIGLYRHYTLVYQKRPMSKQKYNKSKKKPFYSSRLHQNNILSPRTLQVPSPRLLNLQYIWAPESYR